MDQVLVTRRIPQPAIDRLTQAASVLVSPHDRPLSREELLEMSAGCKGVLATLKDAIDRDFLTARPEVKVVANHAVGYDNIDLAAARDLGVAIANTPDVLTDTTADQALALMLAVMRRVVEGDKIVRADQWPGYGPLYLLGADLGGKVLGVYGLGRIGQAVARRAKAFNMEIVYHNRKPNPAAEAELGARWLDFPDFLAAADVISINAPLNPQTRHAFRLTTLRQMKQGAYLVNTGRGPIIKEADLVQVLEEGHLAGAGLDVFEDEPRVHPGLIKLDSVVLNPHSGSATLECRTRIGLLAAENIIAFLQGAPMPSQVI